MLRQIDRHFDEHFKVAVLVFHNTSPNRVSGNHVLPNIASAGLTPLPRCRTYAIEPLFKKSGQAA